ncbi:MAG: transposase [Desulfobacterales bacterium]|nr:transposase [Desulfobacterales bacterium]
MPRKARIDAPGALQHIIFRGIEKRAIFADDTDYQRFLERLATVLPETNTPCFAWALMPNHVHLLMKTGEIPISTIMRRLLTGYAVQFNRRHRRHGHLFQNRYRSFLCEEEKYFKELVRYLHLNPLRANVVHDFDALSNYPYCGHSVMLGNIERGWHDTDYVLQRFGTNVGQARKAYSAFVMKGIPLGRRPELVGGGLVRSMGGWVALKEYRDSGRSVASDERILGSGDFVKATLRQANEAMEKRGRARAKGLDLDQVKRCVADLVSVPCETITSVGRKRKVALARSLICWFAVERLQMSAADVARQLSLSPSAVSRLIDRGRNETLRFRVEESLL